MKLGPLLCSPMYGSDIARVVGDNVKRQAKQSCHFASMFGLLCLRMQTSVNVLLF